MKQQTNTVQRSPVSRVQVDPHFGLSGRQAAYYAENGWDNAPVDPPSKSVSEIIRENVFTYFNLIFAILSGLLILVGSFRDLTFLPVIIANALIGIIQELRAKKTLEKLSVLNAPRAHVLRDGTWMEIPAEALVIDDIVRFQAGSQIPADAVVLSGSVSVNESLLTGEADEIPKTSGCRLLSGSFVVSGECKAAIEKVGADSYISKLTIQAKEMREGEQSEMIRSLNKLVMISGILIIPIGITLLLQQLIFHHASFAQSVTSMVAAVIGMIPEGLFLLASVTLAVSAVRLGMKNVLVHDMKCIETLARIDVLCVDKTGTITENTMQVSSFEILPDASDLLSDAEAEQLIGDFVSAQAADNITMAAMQDFFVKKGGRKVISRTGFSSAYKYSSVTFENECFVLGAPEFILRDAYQNYQDRIEEAGSDGSRVLIFGKYSDIPDGKALCAPVIPYCMILLANPIRENAPDTFRYFHEQGVAIKVISGDNPVTVSRIAAEAGIANAEAYIDASELKTETQADLALRQYTVFGRVTPDQKRMFVRILKEQGHTVAMTGDGVNDVLALKDADCSVAMASGSDAACQASQLVLLDSDFSRMPDVVREGRQVVNNLERSGSLFLVKNIFSFLLALLSIYFSLRYPLRPSQVSLISMFTIGIPAFFLSQAPNNRLIKGHFTANILLKALPAGLTDTFVVGALVIFGYTFDVNTVDISTAATMLLAIVGFMILYQVSKPMDAYKWSIWGVCLLLMILCMIFLDKLFGITKMSVQCMMLLVVFSIVTEPVFRYSTLFFERAVVCFRKIRARFQKKK